MAATSSSVRLPVRFVVATFVVAALIAGLVLYFGLRGQLGGPIP